MPVFTDQALKDRLSELAMRTARKGIVTATRFLSPEEAAFAVAVGKKAGVAATLYGGYDGAERVICGYHDDLDEPQFDIGFVEITWADRHHTLGHRDLLGSILSLGMERGHVGDIVVGKGRATVAATKQMAHLIAGQLMKAGNVPVNCRETDAFDHEVAQEQQTLRDTVASLRLDNVLASGMRTSRSKAAMWINASKVYLNHALCERADKQLTQGDMISVRGYGRMQLTEILPPTKKDRIPIILALFTNK